MTQQQQAWLDANPNYQLCGPPRAGVSYIDAGTLYSDGRFEKMQSMKPVKLEPGCKLVGIKVHANT